MTFFVWFFWGGVKGRLYMTCLWLNACIMKGKYMKAQ